MNNYNCTYCNTSFKTVSSLNLHKKKASYCLKIQGTKQTLTHNFKCDFCNKILTSKRNLEIHVCNTQNLREIITSLKNTINSKDISLNNSKSQISSLLNMIESFKEKVIEKNVLDSINEKENTALINKLQNEIKSLKEQTVIQHNTNNLNCNQINTDNIHTNNLILNDITIIARPKDGYINLTQLCKAGGKEFKAWFRNKNTEAFLQVLSSSVHILTDELIIYETGSNENRATWGHPQVAINIAQWISPQFDVQVSKWIFELTVTGKVELGNEKSNIELENLYQEKINNLQNKLKNYETTIFNRNIDYCPIEYYGKDIVYFIKFNIPTNLHSEYISKYPNIDNKDYSCIEFGVSSDFEKRLFSHKRDKKKDNVIFLHAIELKKRYTASKMELYVKTIIKQLNLSFNYEKKKECFISNEYEFNILINKIIEGSKNLEDIEDEILEDNIVKENEEEEDMIINEEDVKDTIGLVDGTKIEIHKIDKDNERKDKKLQTITELLKTKIITLEDYKELLMIV